MIGAENILEWLRKAPGRRRVKKSGLDHLKELGVSHVHLLPAFDFAGGDERQKADDYTWYAWGYDPVLYNTPEGSYASNPDGTIRQKEFKKMVQAFHKNNIGVVMDVVYNHTAATGAGTGLIFDKVYPRYYYRMDGSGNMRTGRAAATSSPRKSRWRGNSSWIPSSIG